MQIDDLSKVLYMFKTIVNNGFFFFFKCHYSKYQCTPFLFKIEKDFNIDDYKRKNT